MNKKYLTKTIVYFVLALVVTTPMVWVFSGTIVALFITSGNILQIIQIVRYLHIGVAILGLIFLGLGVYNLIKLLGDEESGKEKQN